MKYEKINEILEWIKEHKYPDSTQPLVQDVNILERWLPDCDRVFKILLSDFIHKVWLYIGGYREKEVVVMALMIINNELQELFIKKAVNTN